MRRLLSVFLTIFFLIGSPLYSQAPEPVAQPAGFKAQHTGGRIKMFFNKAVSSLDTRPYTEVKFSNSGEKVLWNSQGRNAYEVRGAKGEVLYRKSYDASPNMKKIQIQGPADLGGFARYQGKLAEARAKMDLTRAQAQALKVKSQGGLASAQELKTLKGLEKQIPRYEKAYRSLETKVSLKSSGPARSKMTSGFKGALTGVGIYAGAQILSDAISNDGNVDPARALAPMLQPSFLTGIGGGAMGAMILSRIPIPGIGGGLLKALPMFLGGAVGFEVGSGNVGRTNWTKLISSTAASALAFGLIGGPIGIGVSILAGMAVDKLFSSFEEVTPPMNYEPQWQTMAQPIPAAESLQAPPVQGNFQQQILEPFPQQPTVFQPQVEAPVVFQQAPIAPAKPGEIEKLKAEMSSYYENYIQLLRSRNGSQAREQYELYKKSKNRLVELGSQ
ncbi:hypothetical protein HOF92_06915 [bacterium]|nr:hypothetical protein [bacterium]